VVCGRATDPGQLAGPRRRPSPGRFAYLLVALAGYVAGRSLPHLL